MLRRPTNITLGNDVKDQATGDGGIYDFVNLTGGGQFVTLMEKAVASDNYDEIDRAIRETLPDYLYDDRTYGQRQRAGAGKEINLRELIEFRQGKGDPKPVSERSNSKRTTGVLKVTPKIYSEKELDKRLLCHKYKRRGAVGETLLHVCMLNRSPIHNALAKRLIHVYPNLIFDYYIGQEFYGENALHMAIANGDDEMFEFLFKHIQQLKKRATATERDYLNELLNQRACGTFFLPKDQKFDFQDDSSMLKETLTLGVDTDYKGSAYYGEYPVSFAACLGREKMLDLMLPEVDLRVQDTNGCTLLHMLVIHKNKELFGKILEKAPELLHVRNLQGLTPLTLAAKLAHIEMYDVILTSERQVAWTFGGVSCAAYPLRYIDSINETDGTIDADSAMYHIVYGSKPDHTRMISGVVGHILDEKWELYAKWRLWRRAALFSLYFLMALIAFYLRPAKDPARQRVSEETNNGSEFNNYTEQDPCYLSRIEHPKHEAIIRLAMEGCVLIGSLIYLYHYAEDIRNLGFRTFSDSLWNCPPKFLFLLSKFITILVVPGRAACAHTYDDVMSVFAVLTIAPYFLFFLSAWEVIGTFVIMIYKMIRKDLLKFLCIYLIFVLGFSQAMYLLFVDVREDYIAFEDPFDSVLAMFVMSLGEFGNMYQSFRYTKYPVVPKALFLVYMVLVTLLLINLLIAMMADTYISVRTQFTKGEWLKERANIILLLEQSMDADTRRRLQKDYSSRIHFKQDDSDSSITLDASQGAKLRHRAFIYRWHHTDEENEIIQSRKQNAH